MRDIEFRGKRTEGKGWAFGSFVLDAIDQPRIAIKDGGGLVFPHVQPETAGQFTGLKDKNGKKIFEGDILSHGDKNILYVVEWIDCGLIAMQIGNRSGVGMTYWADASEVIGNVHDNPELLEGKNGVSVLQRE